MGSDGMGFAFLGVWKIGWRGRGGFEGGTVDCFDCESGCRSMQIAKYK